MDYIESLRWYFTKTVNTVNQDGWISGVVDEEAFSDFISYQEYEDKRRS